MDVERAIDELFALPLDRFTAARDQLASGLKSSDREAAARVRGLRKPTVGAWTVNQLARVESQALEELGTLCEQLAGAEGPEALRVAARTRRDLVARLSSAAERILGDAGHGASPATKERVSAILLSQWSDEDREAILSGRLSREPAPQEVDLGVFAGLGDAMVYEATAGPDERDEEALAVATAEADAAEAEAGRLEVAADGAAQAAEAAARSAARARRRADELRNHAEELRNRLRGSGAAGEMGE